MTSAQAPNQMDKVVLPSASWVRFLRSYGPTPNNLTLFDEYVTGALNKAKVQPITLSSPLLDAIKNRVDSGVQGSVLIAGTAGDGKTYHCRSLWTHLGGDSKAWMEPGPLKELELSDGRLAVFVKDLSELNEEQSQSVLLTLENSVLGNEEKKFLIVAANHGQILERLRDQGSRQERNHPLRKPIQDAFLQAGSPPERLAIFDLSRASSRETLTEVLQAVAGHPEWDNCSQCPLQTAERICPISENRKRILVGSDEGRFAMRLGDLVEVARLNGWHLPVRDLLALVSNIILGHPDAKEGLMACGDIARLQDQNEVENASLYNNVFGSNLPVRRAMARPVFKALSTFGIGSETSNACDGLLAYGADDPKLMEAFERLISNDKVYGATQGYLSSLRRYLDGDEEARLETGVKDFLIRLQAQRRRLFFTLPDNEPDFLFWALAAFCYAGDYQAMSRALSETKAVDEITRARLVRGLNRVMTGLLIENNDKLFVASSGGFTQSRVSVLCDTEASARRSGGTGMRIRLDALSRITVIDVALAPGDEYSASFSLTPVRFEFLCRVAQGALPGSFSNECLEDMLAFKAKLLRKAEILQNKQRAEDEEPGATDSALTLKFIEIEQSGHGFSRPVSVRTIS